MFRGHPNFPKCSLPSVCVFSLPIWRNSKNTLLPFSVISRTLLIFIFIISAVLPTQLIVFIMDLIIYPPLPQIHQRAYNLPLYTKHQYRQNGAQCTTHRKPFLNVYKYTLFIIIYLKPITVLRYSPRL